MQRLHKGRGWLQAGQSASAFFSSTRASKLLCIQLQSTTASTWTWTWTWLNVYDCPQDRSALRIIGATPKRMFDRDCAKYTIDGPTLEVSRELWLEWVQGVAQDHPMASTAEQSLGAATPCVMTVLHWPLRGEAWVALRTPISSLLLLPRPNLYCLLLPACSNPPPGMRSSVCVRRPVVLAD